MSTKMKKLCLKDHSHNSYQEMNKRLKNKNKNVKGVNNFKRKSKKFLLLLMKQRKLR